MTLSYPRLIALLWRVHLKLAQHLPDAQKHEEDGKRPSQHVFDEMARTNLIALRMGPGKHLEGKEIMGGLVKPEEVSLITVQDSVGTYLDSSSITSMNSSWVSDQAADSDPRH